MANSVRLYTIAFEKDGKPISNLSTLDFLKSIDASLNNKTESSVYETSNEYIRHFKAFYDNNNSDRIFIPFGKLKTKNKPYYLNDKKELTEVSQELFDVNTLGYDESERVLVFTTNRDGIGIKYVEEYLNHYNDDKTITLVIRPILNSKGLAMIKKASFIRSVIINLDLGQTLNNFYLGKSQDETDKKGINKILKLFANNAKERLDSKKLSIEFGVGRIGKNGTLDIENIKSLLNEINISEEFLKEIIVAYKNDEEEKIEYTKIKDSSEILTYKFFINSSNISAEYMRDNFDDCLQKTKRYFLKPIKEYFR